VKRAAVLLLLTSACSSSAPTDAGPDGMQADAAEAPTDAGTQEMDAAMATVTSLNIMLAGQARELTRAQMGFESKDGGVTGFYVEAHAGGDPMCTGPNSPTPNYTMVLSGVSVVTPGTRLTTADGLQVSLLDFVGDLTPTPAPVRATAVDFEVLDVVTSPDSEAVLRGNLTASFDGGSITGTVSAEHCASLDG